MRPKNKSKKLGWILIHTKKSWEEWGTSPGEELKRRWKPKKPFPWGWSQYMKPSDRDYVLLFAWENQIIGRADANITEPSDRHFKCDFLVNDYAPADQPFVSLSQLRVKRPCGGLLVLDEETMARYQKKALTIRNSANR